MRCGCILLAVLILANVADAAQADRQTAATTVGEQPPFQVAPEMFDPVQPATLGLSPPAVIDHVSVFRASLHGNHYNHAAVPFAFGDRLYVQWQTSAVDEDAPDTHVVYAVSDDAGLSWSAPARLAANRDDAIVTSGGWWHDGDTLIAYLNVWRGGVRARDAHVEYLTSRDGKHWSAPRPVHDAAGEPLRGVIEQDIHLLPSGRLLTALHRSPGLLVTPLYTDDPAGITGWRMAAMPNLPHAPEQGRELEPSSFLQRDGHVVMIFRDQGNSFRLLASHSSDNAATWSQPAITALPDSRAKQSAGNLPDGTAFIVNNPSGSKARVPLVISTSAGGERFDRAWLLRNGARDLPPQRYAGRYKRAGFSYPKSLIWRGWLFVAYAVNKEDIVITRVPLTALQ